MSLFPKKVECSFKIYTFSCTYVTFELKYWGWIKKEKKPILNGKSIEINK